MQKYIECDETKRNPNIAATEGKKKDLMRHFLRSSNQICSRIKMFLITLSARLDSLRALPSASRQPRQRLRILQPTNIRHNLNARLCRCWFLRSICSRAPASILFIQSCSHTVCKSKRGHIRSMKRRSEFEKEMIWGKYREMRDQMQ